MTTDNRTNEPNQNETKSGQTFCFTEAQVEAAAKAHRKHGKGDEYAGIVCRECDEYFEDRAGFEEHRMRAALVAAAGAAPQAESDDCPTPGNHAPELPSSTVDEAFERAKLTIEGVHQVHGVECLCGFKSNRSRSRTEHITHALKAEWLKEQGL